MLFVRQGNCTHSTTTLRGPELSSASGRIIEKKKNGRRYIKKAIPGYPEDGVNII